MSGIESLLETAALRLGHFGFFHPDRDWKVTARVIEDWQFYFFLDQPARFEQAERKCVLRPGEVLLCAPRIPYELWPTTSKSPNHLSVHFQLVSAGGADLMHYLFRSSAILPAPEKTIGSLMKEVMKLPPEKSRPRMELLLRLYLLDAVHHRNVQAGSPVEGSEWLVRLHESIQSHLDEKSPLRGVAQDLGLSLEALEKKARKHTGRRPLQLILDAKIEKARRLLASGESVTACARELGFSDVFYFSKAFKKIVGVSPKHHVNNLKHG
ncbi:MAG: helix-turn-helix transcriptional regulator [Spirochaetia bacterium]|nr:helix-turn-helix transcriptional regulator [Spirochaetia bacterium]